jgi:hypothetical protein
MTKDGINLTNIAVILIQIASMATERHLQIMAEDLNVNIYMLYWSMNTDRETSTNSIMAYLLKARTVEPEKQPLLGNGYVTRNNGLTVGSGVSCADSAEAL